MTTVRINGPRVPPEVREVEFTSPVEDLEDLLMKLIAFKPESKALLVSKEGIRTDINILVNGRHCMFINGLKTRVGPKDIVDIILPMIGG